MPKKKIPKKKEDVHEVFEVEEKGKEKIVSTDSKEEVLVEKPGQKKHQKKVLITFLITLGLIIVAVFASNYYLENLRYSDYDGVPFTTVAEGDLIFYRSSIDIMYKGALTPYNFYLRTKPKILEKIPFDREGFELMKYSVINYEISDFECEGDQVIAFANLKKIQDIVGIHSMKDPAATCDKEGRYTYFNFIPGETTTFEKLGDKCYNVYVAECKILPATEKIMAEILYHLKE
jgi:hypothetical protein